MDNSQGNFTLDTSAKSGTVWRHLLLDFAAHNESAPDGYEVPRFVDVLINTVEDAINNPADLRLLGAGQSQGRKLALSWPDTVAGLHYYLRHPGPEPQKGGDRVQVTCTVHDGSRCNQWTIRPLGSAALYACPLKNCRTETYVGTFSMPFEFVLDRLP
jgi:hypothetical protein